MEDTTTGLIIGRPKDCKHWGQPIRVAYIVRHDSSRLMEDPHRHLDTGRLIEQDYKRLGDPR
jgi:hypothetical protein